MPTHPYVTHPSAVQPSPLKGIFWMVLHALIMSVMFVIVRLLSKPGLGDSTPLPSFEIVFFYNILAWLFFQPYLLYRHKSKQRVALKTKKLKLHVARGFLGVLSFAIFFYALTLIPLTAATAISFTGPLFTTMLAIFFLKEHLSKHRIVGLLAGFVGAWIILRPGMSAFDPNALLVIATVMLWGISDLIIKNLGKTESTEVQVFYVTLFAALFSLPLAFTQWVMPSGAQWPLLLLAGILLLFKVVTVFKAYQSADLSVIMPFDFSRLIFTSIFAYFLFGELLDHWTFIGSLVIVGSTVYIARHEAMTKRKAVAAMDCD